MTKRDLVVKIAREINLNQSQVADTVQKTLDYIAEELIAGRTIELRNFGVFEIKVRKSSKTRSKNSTPPISSNDQQGETILNNIRLTGKFFRRALMVYWRT